MHIGAKAQDNNEKLNLVTTANEYQQKKKETDVLQMEPNRLPDDV